MKGLVVHRRWVAIGFLVAVAAATRFYDIGTRSYWFDEGVTLAMARLSFPEFLRHAWDPFLNNQLFYYLALRPWHWLGEAESTVRAFSAVFSIGAVAVVYLLGRGLFGAAGGLVAAVILALHPWVIRYAQEARAYSLAIFLVALAALFLARFIESRSRSDLVAWVVASGFALYAHFFSGLAIAAQVLSLVALGWQELRQRRALLWAVLVLACLELPIAVFLLVTPKGLVDWVPPVDVSRLGTIGRVLAGGRNFHLFLFLALLAATVPLAVKSPTPRGRWAATLVLSWALLPTLIMAAVSLRQPILVGRYVLMSVPAFALAVGAVFGSLLERGRLAYLGYALLGSIVIADIDVLVKDIYGGWYEDWRTPAAEVAAATRPGDAILYDHPWGGLTFGYYLDRAARRPEKLQAGLLLFENRFDVGQAEKHERIWVVLSREDKAQTETLLSMLGRMHPVASSKKYSSGDIKVLLLDVSRRAHDAGAFGY